MQWYILVALINFVLIFSCSAEEYNKNGEISSKAYTDDSNDNITGGLAEQDPTDPQYKKMAEESLQKYVNDIGSKQDHKLLQVTKVTTQVVAGTLTRINFYAAPTYCQLLNRKKPSNRLCAEDLSRIISCSTEIWEQVWIDKKEVKVSCNPNFEDISGVKLQD